MKHIITLAAASIAVLSGCMSETGTQASVTAADQFIGKSLVSSDGTVFQFKADGTVGGSARGEAIVGTYTADEREICSTYAQPQFLTGREFCSTPTVNGNTVVFNRRDGSQSSAYTIEG